MRYFFALILLGMPWVLSAMNSARRLLGEQAKHKMPSPSWDGRERYPGRHQVIEKVKHAGGMRRSSSAPGIIVGAREEFLRHQSSFEEARAQPCPIKLAGYALTTIAGLEGQFKNSACSASIKGLHASLILLTTKPANLDDLTGQEAKMIKAAYEGVDSASACEGNQRRFTLALLASLATQYPKARRTLDPLSSSIRAELERIES